MVAFRLNKKSIAFGFALALTAESAVFGAQSPQKPAENKPSAQHPVPKRSPRKLPPGSVIVESKSLGPNALPSPVKSPYPFGLGRHEAIHWILRLVFFFTGILFFRSWRRNDEPEVTGTLRATATTGAKFDKQGKLANHAGARFHARPVILSRQKTSFDATNAHLSDVILRFGDPQKPADETPQHSAAGTPIIDLGVPSNPAHLLQADAHSMEVKLRAASAAQEAERARGFGFRPLPPKLAAHFALFPDEAVVWSAPFSVKGYFSGYLALTNLRFLAAYTKRSFTILPPQVSFELKRVATPLTQIDGASTSTERRALFAVMTILCAPFAPFGSLFAAAGVVLFLVGKRARLEVRSQGQIRRFPLPLVDAQEAARMITKIKADRSSGVKPAA